MRPIARVPFLVTAILCLPLSGCSSYGLINAAPDQMDSVVVEFTEGQLLGWTEVPATAYFVPDSQMIIFGQPGQVGNVPDTGRPIWVSVIGAAGTIMGGGGTSGGPGGGGKIDLQGVDDAMRINLTSHANLVTRRLIATGNYANHFATSEAPSTSVLSVFSTVILNYINDTDAVLFILLKAHLKGSSSRSPHWESRYFISSGKALPVVGDGSWAELGSDGIERALASDLERAIAFMLSDISSPRARDDNDLYTVDSRFPYLRERMQTVGYKLDEDNQSIYFAPKIDDSMSFSGIHILAKSVTSYRKAAKGDVGLAGFRILKKQTDRQSASGR